MNYKCGHQIIDYRPPTFWATIDCPACKDLKMLMAMAIDTGFQPPVSPRAGHRPLSATITVARVGHRNETQYVRAVTCECGRVYRQLGHYSHGAHLIRGNGDQAFFSDSRDGYSHRNEMVWQNWCPAE
jgi:hypothetical protein